MEETAQRPDRRPDRRPGLSLGRVLGFPVYLNASVLLLAVLVTVVYGEFVRTQLDVPPPVRYAVGLGFVVCLLGSVLLHELGHALTARRYGIGVRGITLEMLGGYTEMDRDAPTPRVDLLVSLAGPAVSLLLGLVAVVVTVLLPDRTLIDQLAFQLAVANLLVAAFNSLPGLPLDGGRALRAAVWAMTRDRHVGTEVAGWVGRLVAAVTALVVVTLTVTGLLSPFGLIFMLLVSFTLWQGAGQSIRVARIGRRFPLVDLAALARPIFAVPSGTSLAEAERRGAEASGSGPVGAADRGMPAVGVVDAAGRLVALVDRTAAAAVPAPRRPWVAVDTVARGVDGLPRIPVGLDGEQVVRTVQERPGAQYLVTRDDEVIGVLQVADLAQLLEPSRKMNP
ncbi:M50 family metallopeptidase [Solwaraspora sp. WMMA2101]|uniref:M50 family metallopeptidase n=1 Tax=Solwaraspora sp. WMMA2101 TaxID=3404124 RepID=UPI003B9556E4